MFRRYKLKNFDFLLVLLVIALNVIGILAIGSAKQSVQSKQILGMAAVSYTHLDVYKRQVVYGRDIVVGLPVEREIPTDLINSCLEEHFNTIIDSVKVILERTPPELGADIFKHGVYLTGGASQTSHFAELLQKSTGLKVNQAQRPLESVVLGMGRILKEDNYKSVAYAIEGMGK